MQPNLFSLLALHPECAPQFFGPVSLNDITAICLGLSPVQQVLIKPHTHTDEFLLDEFKPHLIATAAPGGFHVEDLRNDPDASWAAKVIQALDARARAARAAARAEREASALAADKAKERARAVALPHPECPEFFELEARARAVL